MLIPNDNYYVHFAGHEVETLPCIDSVHSIGAAFLVGCLLTDLGVLDVLAESFGASKADAIVTAGTYMACKGNVFEHVTD